MNRTALQFRRRSHAAVRPGQLQLYGDRRRSRGTDFVSNPSRFLFQRTNRKACAGVTVAEILRDPRFKTAAAFALRYVHEVVQKQFAITPSISTNDDGMAKSDTTRVVSDNTSAPGGCSQFAVLRQWNPIDNQDSDALRIPNTGQMSIGQVLWT